MVLCTNCHEPAPPVVAIDIDGTIADYHRHFQNFAELYLNKTVGPRDRDGWKKTYDYSCEFNEWLRLEKSVYRQVKLAYRQGGMKRLMPIDDNARELFYGIKKRGAELWIATARPWMRLDNIDPDTQHWLEKHGLRYDRLLYGSDKYEQLLERVGRNRIVAVMDDEPEQILTARSLGLNAIHRVRHVEPWLPPPCSTGLAGALALIKCAVRDWADIYEKEAT